MPLKGNVPSEATRLKMSIARRARLIQPNAGKKFSEEWRANMGKAHLGMVTSEETKEKISQHHVKAQLNVGRKLSEETKQKQSESLKAFWLSPEGQALKDSNSIKVKHWWTTPQGKKVKGTVGEAIREYWANHYNAEAVEENKLFRDKDGNLLPDFLERYNTWQGCSTPVVIPKSEPKPEPIAIRKPQPLIEFNKHSGIKAQPNHPWKNIIHAEAQEVLARAAKRKN